EGPARDLLLDERMMTFKHVLVPTDFGAASERARDCAIEVARRFRAKVTILHALALPAPFYFPYARDLSWLSDELEVDAQKEVDALVLRVKSSYPEVTGRVVGGEPWPGL
ncbi:MAG: universal stress protein, partial [Pirellulaceae bacterium]|nr:universal stress protein [Pirellulaceae bacterium]